MKVVRHSYSMMNLAAAPSYSINRLQRLCSGVLSRNITIKTTYLSSDKTNDLMKLESVDENNRSLYVCNVETDDKSVTYVIRTVKLSDLFSSSSPVTLGQVTRYSSPHLPLGVGCGVLGSQIFFTSGFTRGPLSQRDVYTLETHANDPNASITKHDAKLQTGKDMGQTIQLYGKLYVLSYSIVDDPPSFEVYDPKIDRWEGLSQPPFFIMGTPYYHGPGFYHLSYSYAVAATKIFVSNQRSPVFCFDVANPEREWRMVSTMCNGGPFLFNDTALVLDLPHEDDMKIMFSFTLLPWSLQVYLLSLSENKENLKKIAEFQLPPLPEELGLGTFPSRCEFFHIGGKRACLAITIIYRLDGEEEEEIHGGVVIPFQYELDMTKVGKDETNGLTF